MTGLLWNLGSFLLALGILIAVHEFGHFWVARRCGVIVEKFSIGFGKSIWRKVAKDGTEYSLSMIPLGGYVKMLDERVDEVPVELKHRAFNNRPLWQRTSIVAAGPIANFLFAIFAYWVVYLIGIPAVKPVIGDVTPNSIVAQAGIESGMELKAISGLKTADWESVNMALISHIGDDKMTLTVTSSDQIGVEQTKVLDLSAWQFDPEHDSAMRTLGFTPFSPEITPLIAHIGEQSAAEAAGLQVNDELLEINGVEVKNWQQVVDTIQASPSQDVLITVLRENNTQNVVLVPSSRELSDGRVVGFAGIGPQVAEWPEDYRFELRFGAIEAVGKAVEKTGQLIDLTVGMVVKLITGDVAVKNLSGPISIAKGAGMTADYGLVYFLGFLALISVNLGIINLLPLPVLDGGHLLFFAIEAVTRKPVSEKVQDIGYRVGSAIIVMLMAVALFNDFTRL